MHRGDIVKITKRIRKAVTLEDAVELLIAFIRANKESQEKPNIPLIREVGTKEYVLYQHLSILKELNVDPKVIELVEQALRDRGE